VLSWVAFGLIELGATCLAVGCLDFSLYGGADSPSPPSTAPSDGTDSSEDDVELLTSGPTSLRQRQLASSTVTKDSPDDREHARVYGLDRTDFLWSATEEPHRSRRLQILKDHPEVSPKFR
jgi:sphingolipid delta-4 desaturase